MRHSFFAASVEKEKQLNERLHLFRCPYRNRTYGGTLRDVHSSELGTAAAKAAIERAGVDKEAIDEVLFGQVLQGGVGQNVARQVCLKSGLPITTPAMTLNKVCASSMRAISLGTQIIRSGENKMMLVGGCESMSGAPYISRDTRWGARMGDKKLVDMMVYDGVFDVFNQYHMGITAENVAESTASPARCRTRSLSLPAEGCCCHR